MNPPIGWAVASYTARGGRFPKNFRAFYIQRMYSYRTRLGPRTTTLPPFATYESTSTTLSSFLIVRNHKNNLEALGTQLEKRSKAGSTSKKTTHPSSRSTKQNPEEQRGKSKLTWRRIAVEFRRTCEFVCLCISRLQRACFSRCFVALS